MDILLGAAASVIVQAIKKYFGTNDYITLLVVLVISLLVALFYWWISWLGYWAAFARVLTTAGAVYVFVIRRFEE